MPDRRQTTAQDLLKREAQLRSQRKNVDWRAQEIADYIAPSKATITRQPFEGQKLTTFLFDAEAPWASTMLANTLAGAFTSPAQKFFSLSLEPPELTEDKETEDWMGDCSYRP